MKRFLLFITSILVIALVSSLGGYVAFADEQSGLVEEFNTCYQTVETCINSTGITSESMPNVLTTAGRAVEIAEIIEANYDPDFKLKNRNAFEMVFTAYKNASIKKISLSYDASSYTPTDNGLVLVHQKEGEAITSIRNAITKSEIDGAVSGFVEFLSTSNLSKYAFYVSTASEANITATVISETAIFAEEDYLTVSKFNSSVIEKNLKTALYNNSNVKVNNGGVAYYFSLRWVSGGVIQGDTAVPVAVAVELSDLGLNLQDGDPVQIARYVKNGEVVFTDAAVVDGYVVFALTAFGGDIESTYDLDFAVIAAGYETSEPGAVGKFIEENWLIIVIIVGVIIIVWAIGAIISRKKKKKLKKEFKQFKKERKKEKKNKNKRRVR